MTPTDNATHPAAESAGLRRGAGRYIFVIPVAAFALMAVAFAVGLTLDPSKISSVLIGKPVPEFRLPPVQGRTLGLSSDDLKGEVTLVNVFASWCLECRVEHPLFMRLQADGTVPIHGINYKDKPEDAANWLDSLGDPYTRTGADRDGRVAIEWGVYGVPETFVIDRSGTIRYKHIGALSPKILDETILPLVEQLRQAAP
jgi:cytochrome c biogenesis protein CcmG/thiol:disulfide interchange protein DsbE